MVEVRGCPRCGGEWEDDECTVCELGEWTAGILQAKAMEHVHRAHHWIRLDQMKASEAELHKSLEFTPFSPEAQTLLSLLEWNRGACVQAMARMEWTASRFPAFHLVNQYIDQANLAREAFRQALSLCHSGRWKEALALLDMRKGQAVDGHLLAVLCHLQLGDRQQALVQLEEAQKMAPDDDEVIRFGRMLKEDPTPIRRGWLNRIIQTIFSKKGVGE